VRVRQVTSDEATADPLARAAGDVEAALKELGCQVVADDSNLTVDVVLTDDYLRADLEAINREAIAANRPWLLVKPVGLVLWLGPIIEPGVTACWKCLAQRVRGNRHVETY